MDLINLVYAVPKLAEVWSIDYIENVVDNSMIKRTINFEVNDTFEAPIDVLMKLMEFLVQNLLYY